MSHVTKISLKLKDETAIMEACKELGLKATRHDQPVELKGYSGGPTGIMCEIVIPGKTVGSMSADMGFAQEDDGSWAGHIDFWDLGGNGRQWEAKFNQAYSLSLIKRQMNAQGWALTQESTKGGQPAFVFQSLTG